MQISGQRTYSRRRVLWKRGQQYHSFSATTEACTCTGYQSECFGYHTRGLRRIPICEEIQRKGNKTLAHLDLCEIQEIDKITLTFLSQLVQRILEAHANVKDLSLIEAKLNYIKAWQSLPEYGISLFVVRFTGKNKDELLGIANNRLMRMELHSGDHLKTWRYNTMKVRTYIYAYLYYCIYIIRIALHSSQFVPTLVYLYNTNILQ